MAILDQTEEQRRAAYLAAGVPISSASLLPSSTPQVTPTIPVSTPDVSALTPEEPKAPTSSPSDLTGRIEALTSQIQGFKPEDIKSQFTQDAERQLADINKQIKLHQAESFKAQEEALKRGETLGFARGESQVVARENAVEALRLSAIAEAIQGNVVLAGKQADRAVNAQFAQMEKDSETARQNILDNYESFNAAEKKRADAALLKLDEKDAFVAEQKSGRKEAQKLALEYVGIADALTLDKMSKAGSAVEVAQIAQSKGLKTLEQRKTEAEIAKLQGVGVGDIISGNMPSTPEQEAKILNSIVSNLPVGQQDGAFGAIASFKNASDIVSLLDEGVKTGPISGRVRGGTLFGLIPGTAKLGIAGNKGLAFDAAATAFTSNYIKALSGVQVSDKERQFLLKALPSPLLQEGQNRANLKQLLNFLKNKYELQLGVKFENFPNEIPDIENVSKLEELFKESQ